MAKYKNKGKNKNSDFWGGATSYCQFKSKASRRRKRGNNDDLPSVYKNAIRVRCASAFSDKWLFHSYDAAKEAIKYNYLSRKNRNRDAGYERAYFCRACNGYHLTKMNSKQWSERKQEIRKKMRFINTARMYDFDNFSIGGGFSNWHSEKR